MRNKIALAALAAVFATSTIVPDAASARHRSHHARVVYRNCSGGNGAVGTVAGGVGGAVIGSAVVGGPVATVVGGVGGALLGRHLDKKNTRARNGCRR
jgi:outer membrane lipoprotein SlyB